jgi:hypothetical protein
MAGSTPAAAGNASVGSTASLARRHLRESAGADPRRWSFSVESSSTVRHQAFANVWQSMQSSFLSVTCLS